jgi:hypothetical protein
VRSPWNKLGGHAAGGALHTPNRIAELDPHPREVEVPPSTRSFVVAGPVAAAAPTARVPGGRGDVEDRALVGELEVVNDGVLQIEQRAE